MSEEEIDSTDQDPRHLRGYTLPPRRRVSFQGIEAMDGNTQWSHETDSDESVAHEHESTSIRTDTSLSSVSASGATNGDLRGDVTGTSEDVEEGDSDDAWEAIEGCLESIFRAWDNGRPLAGPEREILLLIHVYMGDDEVAI